MGATGVELLPGGGSCLLPSQRLRSLSRRWSPFQSISNVFHANANYHVAPNRSHPLRKTSGNNTYFQSQSLCCASPPCFGHSRPGNSFQWVCYPITHYVMSSAIRKGDGEVPRYQVSAHVPPFLSDTSSVSSAPRRGRHERTSRARGGPPGLRKSFPWRC